MNSTYSDPGMERLMEKLEMMDKEEKLIFDENIDKTLSSSIVDDKDDISEDLNQMFAQSSDLIQAEENEALNNVVKLKDNNVLINSKKLKEELRDDKMSNMNHQIHDCSCTETNSKMINQLNDTNAPLVKSTRMRKSTPPIRMHLQFSKLEIKNSKNIEEHCSKSLRKKHRTNQMFKQSTLVEVDCEKSDQQSYNNQNFVQKIKKFLGQKKSKSCKTSVSSDEPQVFVPYRRRSIGVLPSGIGIGMGFCFDDYLYQNRIGHHLSRSYHRSSLVPPETLNHNFSQSSQETTNNSPKQ